MAKHLLYKDHLGRYEWENGCHDDKPAAKINDHHDGNNTVKPLLRGHLRDLQSDRLIEVSKNCATFVNDNFSTVTLYCNKVRVHVVKEAVLYFV